MILRNLMLIVFLLTGISCKTTDQQKAWHAYEHGKLQSALDICAEYTNAECLFIRAEIYHKQGDKKRADQIYQQIVDEYPDSIVKDAWEWKPADISKLRLLEND